MATYLEYLQAAMDRAEYERMEDGEWYAHIPEFKGLWATGSTKEQAQSSLYTALDGWIHVNAHVAKQQLPRLNGLSPFDPPEKVE